MANLRQSKGYVEEVDFGDQTFGYTYTGSIPFNNSSNIPLKVTGVITDSGHGAFSMSNRQVFETFIPARTKHQFPIIFKPLTAGNFNATLNISLNNGRVKINGQGSHQINLSGVAVASAPDKPAFTVSPDIYPFDSRNSEVRIDLKTDVDYYEIRVAPKLGLLSTTAPGYKTLNAPSTYVDGTSIPFHHGSNPDIGYNGESSTYMITGLEFDTEYMIFVLAYNQHGSTASDIIEIKTEIHTLEMEIGGIIPNLNIFDKATGEGAHLHFYDDAHLIVLESSIIYCDTCNTVNERAFNNGLPYRFESTYQPHMPDLPAFSQPKPALTTGKKLMDGDRQLPLTISLHGQVLGSGGVGGHGSGSNPSDSTYMVPPNMARHIGAGHTFNTLTNPERYQDCTGYQFLEGGDAIHIEYDCTLNIYETGKVKGGGGGGYGGGISMHTGYGARRDANGEISGSRGAGDGYTTNIIHHTMSSGPNGSYTPTHYHARANDSESVKNWLVNSGSSRSIDNIWHQIDHTSPFIADDDPRNTHGHIDFFSGGSILTWPNSKWDGNSKNSLDPETGGPIIEPTDPATKHTYLNDSSLIAGSRKIFIAKCMKWVSGRGSRRRKMARSQLEDKYHQLPSENIKWPGTNNINLNSITISAELQDCLDDSTIGNASVLLQSIPTYPTVTVYEADIAAAMQGHDSRAQANNYRGARNNFLGGGGGGGGQGFSSGSGGKAGHSSITNTRRENTGQQKSRGSFSVSYGHLGQLFEGAFPLAKGDNATVDKAGGPSNHYKSALYRLRSHGMRAHSLSGEGAIHQAKDADRPLTADGLWAFWINVHADRGRGRRRTRTASYMRVNRAILDIRGGSGGKYGLYGEERPATSNFGGGDMIDIPADHSARDRRNLGTDSFLRDYIATDIPARAVSLDNPTKVARADAWNIFSFVCLGGDLIALFSAGAPIAVDANSTIDQSFDTNYNAAIFMDKSQKQTLVDGNMIDTGYWDKPSIIAKPSGKKRESINDATRKNLLREASKDPSRVSTSIWCLEFPNNTFAAYQPGDTGTIGTIKPHGFPGKAIVLNGHEVSTDAALLIIRRSGTSKKVKVSHAAGKPIPWGIGQNPLSNIKGLVVPGKVPRLNKHARGGKIYNREYRAFY